MELYLQLYIQGKCMGNLGTKGMDLQPRGEAGHPIILKASTEEVGGHFGTAGFGRTGEAWPAPTGNGPTLKCDSELFEVKVAQDVRNQFDGVKGGEVWKVLVRGYLMSWLALMGHLSKLAENHGNKEITPLEVNGLGAY